LELLVTAATMLHYTLKLERNNWKRTVKLKSTKQPKYAIGMTDHKTREKEKKRIGTVVKIKALDFFGIINSFLTNFNPSSTACNKPNQPTF
jgi:hypothetical protein